VKFTNANTHVGVTVNPNVTAVAGLSTSTTTLGAGPVTLAGGTLLLQGQQSSGFGQQPIGIVTSSFNADTIIDAAAAPGYATVAAVTFNGAPPTNGGNPASTSVYKSSAGVPVQSPGFPGDAHNKLAFFSRTGGAKMATRPVFRLAGFSTAPIQT